MEHVRTGVQRRALIGAGVAVLAFGGVLGAFVTNDDSPRRQEISDTAETTTSSTSTTAEAPATTTTEATVSTVATTVAEAPPATTAPQPLEVVVQEHEQRIDNLEANTAPPPAPPSTVAPPTTLLGTSD